MEFFFRDDETQGAAGSGYACVCSLSHTVPNGVVTVVAPYSTIASCGQAPTSIVQ
jgi:hypothetical protein